MGCSRIREQKNLSFFKTMTTTTDDRERIVAFKGCTLVKFRKWQFEECVRIAKIMREDHEGLLAGGEEPSSGIDEYMKDMNAEMYDVLSSDQLWVLRKIYN